MTALADKIGAHRQHDVRLALPSAPPFQQQADKLVGRFLLRLAGFVETEISSNWSTTSRKWSLRQVGLLDRFDQAEVTAAEVASRFSRHTRSAIVEVGVQERVGQKRQWIAARMRDGDLPRSAARASCRLTTATTVRSGPATICRSRSPLPPRSDCCPGAANNSIVCSPRPKNR